MHTAVSNLHEKMMCKFQTKPCLVGLGGLRVTCSPRDPRFAGSNSAKVDGFFSGRKNPEHKSSGRDFKLGVPSLGFRAR